MKKNFIIYATDLHLGDAIGNFCFGLYKMAHRLGIVPSLVATRTTFDLDVHPPEKLPDLIEHDSILLINYSIYDPNLAWLVDLPCQKLCYFHGVTPPNFIRDFSPELEDLCQKALLQLPQLQLCDRLITNSEQSANQLLLHGVKRNIDVIPPVFGDMALLKQPLQLDTRPDTTPTLLVVARIVPHKKIEAAIEVLANLNRDGQQYQMLIVGDLSNDRYFSFLLQRAREMGVLDVITFTGKVSTSNLHQCYLRSTLLLSCSLHEGFCVPALEAMYFGKPVFALSGTAMDSFLCQPGGVYESLPQLTNAIRSYLVKQQTSAVIDQLHQHSLGLIAKSADAEWLSLVNDVKKVI